MSSDESFKPSRRQVAAGVMVTTAAAIATPAAAQNTSPSASSSGGAMTNPITEYPHPPFPKQQQEPPGLSLKMHPRPNYGEKTYRGSDYAATNGAIVAFTKALAKQVAQKGIRVNAVAPGPIWTPLQISGGQPVSKTMKFGETSPYERPGQPAELAPIYVLLASKEASYTTGSVYGVTGGRGGP